MLRTRFIRAAALGAFLATSAGVAGAATVTVSKQMSSVFGTNGYTRVKIVDDDYIPDGTRVNVGAFALTADGLDDFIAWCLDISTGIRNYTAYNVIEDAPGLVPFTTPPVTAAKKSDIQALFDQRYASLDLSSNVQSTAFQLALWEIVNEDRSNYNISRGSFKARYLSSSIKNLTTTFLDGLSATVTQAYDMVFLESVGHRSQNLVTVSPMGPDTIPPVPVPAAGFLLLGALGGLGAYRRLKKA